MSLSMAFSKVIQRSLLKKPVSALVVSSKFYSLWEPDYLILGKTKTPEYDLINVELKSYDFVLLESFQRVVHRLARILELNVADAWAAPSQDFRVVKFKPNSSTKDAEYLLKVYERNVQVVDVKSHIMPIFIESILTGCPPGVKISIHPHTAEIAENRRIPDYELIELEKTLSEMHSKKKK